MVSVIKDGLLKYILQFFGIKTDSLFSYGNVIDRRRPDTMYLHYNEHYFPNNLALRYINFTLKLKPLVKTNLKGFEPEGSNELKRNISTALSLS